MSLNQLKIGDQLKLSARHPYGPNTGIVVCFEKTTFGIKPKIRINDLDQSCYVMDTNQISEIRRDGVVVDFFLPLKKIKK